MEAKKVRNRRGYLDNYVKGMDGRYIYTGEYMKFLGTAVAKRAMDVQIIVTASLVFVLLVASSFTLAGDMSRSIYVVIPYVLEVIIGFFLIWYTYKFEHGGNPMKKYIYDKVAGKLPVFGIFTTIAAGLGAVLSVVFMLVNKPEQTMLTLGIIYAVIKAAQAVVGIFFSAAFRKGKWELERGNLA